VVAVSLKNVGGTVLDLSVREGDVGLRRPAATTASVICPQAAEPCLRRPEGTSGPADSSRLE
jgi:hypothetical protein